MVKLARAGDRVRGVRLHRDAADGEAQHVVGSCISAFSAVMARTMSCTASRRSASGVVPACAVSPVSVTVNQRLPWMPVTTPISRCLRLPAAGPARYAPRHRRAARRRAGGAAGRLRPRDARRARRRSARRRDRSRPAKSSMRARAAPGHAAHAAGGEAAAFLVGPGHHLDRAARADTFASCSAASASSPAITP